MNAIRRWFKVRALRAQMQNLRYDSELAADDKSVAEAFRPIIDAFAHIQTRLGNIEETLAAIRAENAKLLASTKRSARK